MEKKILASILAVATIATCAFSAVACNQDVPQEDEVSSSAVKEVKDSGNLEVNDVTGTPGMRLNVVRLSTNYTDGNGEAGIATVAEEAYTLTATVLPADAADKTVTYTAAWQNANSTWAKSKNVNDYVTVTQATAGALTATVTCEQAFGEPIIVTVTSNSNPSAKATATLHFKQKVASYEIYADDDTPILTDGIYYTKYGEGTNNTDLFLRVGYENDGGGFDTYCCGSEVYTRANPDLSDDGDLYNYSYNLNIEPTAEFEAVLTGLGITSVVKGTSDDLGVNFDDFMNNIWLDEKGSTPEKKNQIIDAFLSFEGVAYTATLTDLVENVTVTFNISLDTSIISRQKQVESLTLNNMELEF